MQSNKFDSIQNAQNVFNELSNINIDNDSCITEPFYGFSIGAHREDIWHWIEANHPPFSIAHAMGSK